MSGVMLSKHEFLLDRAAYFADKPELYLRLKSSIAEITSADLAEVRICGSAYWGRRFRDCSPFEPGVSDLDVALISPALFCRCMAEAREVSKNFTDQTVFPKSSKIIPSFEEFQAYAFRKGIIRVDLLPRTKTQRVLIKASDDISRDFLEHFEKITFSIYDSALSFAVKQASAAEKFRK
jgi:hypothetical protein